MLGMFTVAEELQAGRLGPILRDYMMGRFGVFAVYAKRRFLPPKIRLFVDAMVRRFGAHPERDPFLDGIRPSACFSMSLIGEMTGGSGFSTARRAAGGESTSSNNGCTMAASTVWVSANTIIEPKASTAHPR
jgi:hypothetical protein